MRVYVAGHTGLVGSALLRALKARGEDPLVASHRELDLRDPAAVRRWFYSYMPDHVYVAAGTVGGIAANMARPVDFLHDNLLIAANILRAARDFDTTKLLYLGSSCIYPRLAPQPIAEGQLLTGPLEPTNEPYAIAKIAGIRLAQAYRDQYGCDFISAMPTNLYGPGDNYDLTTSHVFAAMIRKFHESRTTGVVQLWGTGTARREFLHVDDLAAACLFLMDRYSGRAHVNVGTGEDISIRDLADQMRAAIHPNAEIRWDTSKPDGMPRKLLDVSHLHDLGWVHRISLPVGIRTTYRAFRANL